ncbi:MAG: P-loop NTPase fold protein [Longimicrobiaceae bacterium]
MARRKEAEAIYTAASEWRTRSLVEGRSIFLPAPLLWRMDNLVALRSAFTGRPQQGPGDFEAKFKRQMDDQHPDVVQLAAEMLWLQFLFPRKLLSAQRKRELVTSVWNWSGTGFHDTDHPYLGESVLAGIGSAGTAFNTQRDRELDALIETVIILKRAAVLTTDHTPWDAAMVVDDIPKAANRNIRNILLHLLFPDQFERVASLARKRQIAKAFSSHLRDYTSIGRDLPVDVDRRLLHIRRKLEEQSPGKEIDFYDVDLQAVWNPPQVATALEAAPITSRSESLREARQEGVTDILREAEGPDLQQLTTGDETASIHALAGVSYAQQIAWRDRRPEPTPDMLFVAFLLLAHHRRYGSVSALALAERIRSAAAQPNADGRLTPLLQEYRLKPGPLGVLPAPSPEPWISRILGAAATIRASVDTGTDTRVSARHVLAILLLPGPLSAAPLLAEYGLDPAELRRVFLDSLESRRLDESNEAWRRLLLGTELPPGADVAVYAGFMTDGLGVDPRRTVSRTDDRLDVMKDVTALCEVLAARQTQPPLAVGLFGDWGTGKSFFMELMRKEIDDLGARNPAFYCSRVVQVVFNAWHYMDTDLWASLAASVFEELSVQPKRWEPREDVRKQLFEQLQDSRGVLAEAVDERKDAEARIDAIREQREQKRKSLAATAETAFDAAVAALSADNEVKEKLRAARDRLGLSEAQAQVQTAGRQARNLGSLAGRLVAIGRTLVREPRFLMLGIPIFAAVAGGAMWVVEHSSLWTGAARGAARAAALIAGLSAAVAPAARHVSRAIAWLEDVGTRLQRQRDSEQRHEEQAIQRDLVRLEERESDAQARVDVLTREIEDLRAGRRLQRFILERHASAEYRQRLGIVNLIRNDFEQLSRLLSESAEDRRQAPDTAAGQGDGISTPPLPQVDRIILYIDDLDRCPEDRVVEVLQAVHLLLAFPLFVVVVGVDSRWLLLSLEDHYAALRGRSGERRENRVKTEAEWSTTPQNYLEKIFQIPFTLRPMEPAGFGSLVEALLPVGEDARAPDGRDARLPETAGEGADAAPRSESTAVNREEEEEGDGEDETTDMEQETGAALPGNAPVLPPNPQGLTVEARERDFIRELHPLIASPRALKRFTNVYRFLRVQQRGVDLDRFRGTVRNPGEFQVVGLLLASLVGYPAEATRLLRGVLTRDDPWWTLVETLDEAGPEEKDTREQGAGTEENGMYPDDRRGRQSLSEALLKVRRTVLVADYPRETFVRWTREVARFSFQSGRILAVRDSGDEMMTAAPPGTIQAPTA